MSQEPAKGRPATEWSAQGRYTSPAHALARMTAQRTILRSYVETKVSVTVHGKEHLKGLKAPFIVVGNHASHLDTALIFSTLPGRLARQVAVGAAADHWFDHWWRAAGPALLFNAFPVERSGKAEHAGRHGRRGLAGQLLSAGVPLLIFPEGTRSRTGALGPFNPGSAALSISRRAPLLPVGIVGTFAAWPTQAKAVRPGRPPVHVVFGRPMSAAPGEIASEFAARARRVITELHDTTARAYDMPTLDDYARAAALRQLTTGPAPSAQPDKEN